MYSIWKAETSKGIIAVTHIDDIISSHQMLIEIFLYGSRCDLKLFGKLFDIEGCACVETTEDCCATDEGGFGFVQFVFIALSKCLMYSSNNFFLPCHSFLYGSTSLIFSLEISESTVAKPSKEETYTESFPSTRL